MRKGRSDGPHDEEEFWDFHFNLADTSPDMVDRSKQLESQENYKTKHSLLHFLVDSTNERHEIGGSTEIEDNRKIYMDINQVCDV